VDTNVICLFLKFVRQAYCLNFDKRNATSLYSNPHNFTPLSPTIFLNSISPPFLQHTIYNNNNVRKVRCTLVQALRLCTDRTVHRGSRGIAVLYRH